MQGPKVKELLELIECGNDLVYVIEHTKLKMPCDESVDRILDAVDAYKAKRKALAGESGK